MSRYPDMEFYSNLSVERGVRMLIKSREKTNEANNRQLYAQLYGQMTEETQFTFEEFYKPAGKQVKEDKRSKEEIIADIEQMMANVSS